MNYKDQNGNKILVSKTVIQTFNAMPQGKTFYGWELKDRCVSIRPELKNVYIETFLRMMRKYFNGCYELKSKAASLYQKTSLQIIVDKVSEKVDSKDGQ